MYIESILALQQLAQQQKPGCILPLAIMTSDDTHQRTADLLAQHDHFGAKTSQITLLKQEKVSDYALRPEHACQQSGPITLPAQQQALTSEASHLHEPRWLHSTLACDPAGRSCCLKDSANWTYSAGVSVGNRKSDMLPCFLQLQRPPLGLKVVLPKALGKSSKSHHQGMVDGSQGR